MHRGLSMFSIPAMGLIGESLASQISKVVVVGGTHGNEYTGVWCIKALDEQLKTSDLSERFPSLRISTLLANPQAYLQNKRFVQSDLNREFSRDKLGKRLHSSSLPLDNVDGDTDVVPHTVESLRAREIDELLGPKFSSDQYNVDVVIDLHSTTSNMGTTLIIPEGDPLMAQAAAYVLHKCGGGNGNHGDNARCLMHSLPSKDQRPNLSSAGKHGFTIEVGPVPQGVIRHDAVENTNHAISALFEFLHRRNLGFPGCIDNDEEDNANGDESLRQKKDQTCMDTATTSKDGTLYQELKQIYKSGTVPCFRSAPAVREGEISGKITWPSDPTNPNFPLYMVHKSLQDRDFYPIKTGDALFVTLDGSIIPYDGSHGEEVYLIFVNEGGYYYKSSGTGIGVAVKAQFDLETGILL